MTPRPSSPSQGIVICPIDINGNGKIDPDESVYATRDDITKAIAGQRLSFAPGPGPLFRHQGQAGEARPRRVPEVGPDRRPEIRPRDRLHPPEPGRSWRDGLDKIGAAGARIGGPLRLFKDVFARKTMFLLTLVPERPRPAHHLRALPEVQGHPGGSSPWERSSFLRPGGAAQGRVRLPSLHHGHPVGDGRRPGHRHPHLPVHGHLSFGIRPEGLPRARQAGHRPAGRHPLGRLRRLGDHGHRPLRRQRPGARSSASTPAATASWPAASSWPS